MCTALVSAPDESSELQDCSRLVPDKSSELLDCSRLGTRRVNIAETMLGMSAATSKSRSKRPALPWLLVTP